jgi:hypothetical protein
LEGVVFEARLVPEGYYRGVGDAVPCQRAGTTEATVLVPRSASKCVVAATAAEGTLVAEGTTAWLPAGDAEAAELLLDLVPAAMIEGRVLDPDSQPVAGAVVRPYMPVVHPRPVVTDADGRFRIPDAAGAVTLGAHAVGFAPVYESITVEPGGRSSVDFRLQAGWELTGVAVDERDRPLSGTLMAWTTGEEQYATVDPTGRFVFRNLGRSAELVLECEPAPGVGCRERIPIPSGEAQVDVGRVRFEFQYLLDVVVVDDRGQGVSCPVVLRSMDVQGREQVQVTASDGRVQLWAPEGRYELSVRGAFADPKTVVVGGHTTPEPVSLMVENTVHMVGRVVYPGESPSFGELLMTVANAAEPEVPDQGPQFATRPRLEADGSFDFTVPGTWARVAIRIGTDASPMSQSDFGMIIAEAEVPVGRRPIEVQIAPESCSGLRLRLTGEDSASTKRIRFMLEREGWKFEIVGAPIPGGGRLFFPLPTGAWRLRAYLKDGGTDVVESVMLGGTPWSEVTIPAPK